jgi:predicted phage tail protein
VARSLGTRIILSAPGAATLYDSGMGISTTDFWFSSIGNYAFYSNNATPTVANQVMKLSGLGILDLSISSGRFRINGTQVVGPRDTGWTAFGATVTANKGVYNPAASYTTSVAYTQAEAAAVAAALVAANARIKALEVALTAHGLIGA